MKPEYKLAEKIHAKMCRWNHTDGCDWSYRSWKTGEGINALGQIIMQIRDEQREQ